MECRQTFDSPALVPLVLPRMHGERGRQQALGVVLLRKPRAEDGHRGVAYDVCGHEPEVTEPNPQASRTACKSQRAVMSATISRG